MDEADNSKTEPTDEAFVFHGGDQEVPKNVTRVIVDASVETIRDSAFAGHKGLKLIDIPLGVKAIGEFAFSHCSAMESIEMPSSVETIGRGAFYSCESLKSIKIALGIKAIGKFAFCDCSAVESIEIPSSIETIGDGAFQDCKSLKSIEMPLGVKAIGEGAFHECSAVESVELPSSIETIGSYAFQECKSLKSIKIPLGIKAIGEGAFFGCSAVESIELPSSVETIGSYAFQECKSLKSIKIPLGVKTIGEGAFWGCSAVESIELPSSVETIGMNAFQDCKSLNSIVIPLGVKAIGNEAFSGCSAMESIELPSSIETIGSDAFYSCGSLKSITIPATVKVIDAGVFANCPCLETIVISGKVESMGISDKADATGDIVILDYPKIEAKAVDYRGVSKSWIQDFLVRPPLHQFCCKAGATKDDILSFIETNPDLVEEEDAFGRNALHVLVTNPEVELEVVQAVIDKCPEALTKKELKGITPLHVACNNQCANLSVIKALSHAYDSKETPPFMVVNKNNDIPRTIAIRKGLNYDICFYLFSQYPAFEDESIGDHHNTPNYVYEYWTFLKSSERHEQIQKFDKYQRDGWVRFISNVPVDWVDYVADEIRKNMDPKNLKALALFKDLQGRSAIDSVRRDIRKAMQDIIFFLGRYDLCKGPPLHKSATSILIKAIDMKAEDEYKEKFEDALKQYPGQQSLGKDDLKGILKDLGIGLEDEFFNEKFKKWDCNKDGRVSEEEFVEILKAEFDQGRPREVAFKFMKSKDHFQREVDSRKNNKMDSLYVVGINHTYSEETTEGFRDSLKSIADSEDLSDICKYPYAIVMPCADRNLDTIYRSEQPNDGKILGYATDLAYALKHIHSNGLIHGDIKLQNVVRLGGRLRLIDFDAAVKKFDDKAKICSCAGVKSSSGVLPPEMIAHLSVDEYTEFIEYFQHTKQDNLEYFEKLSKKAPCVVKTFLAEKVMAKVFENGELVEKEVEAPIKQGLPYELIKASPTVDIWSYGVVLYSLYTGKSLFEVDRNDDARDAKAMEEIHEWTDISKISKLREVKDPMARGLLDRVLSKSPSDRYSTVDELLGDSYFNLSSVAEYMDKFRKDLRDDFQLLLTDCTDAILQRINSSTNVLINSIFEVSEVRTPTCFIVLPDELPTSHDSEEDYLSKEKETVAYITDVVNMAKDCASAPIEFAVEFVKRQFFERSSWLYLVDEYNNMPVCVEGVYPLEVQMRSEQAEKFLPLMAFGMQAIALANGVTGLVSMFYPAFPNRIMSPELQQTINEFIDESNKCGVVHDAAKDNLLESKTVRGSELRDLAEFLIQNDKNRTFAGLKMACDKSSGKAIWVTEESYKLMQMEGQTQSRETDKNNELQDTINVLNGENEKMRNSLAQAKNQVESLEADKLRIETQLAEKSEENENLKAAMKKLGGDKRTDSGRVDSSPMVSANAGCCTIL